MLCTDRDDMLPLEAPARRPQPGLLPLLLATGIVLGACAHSPDATQAPASSAPAASTPGTEAKLASAATAPLSDLNLVRANIPPALATAQRAPYAAPADASCAGIAAEVQALDEALGADLDTPATPGNPGLIERGSSAAGDAMVGAVRNTAEGVIPFRGWVRKLTGAERYAKEVAAAIAAGTVRRAYLKGLGQAASCAAPAAPRR